MASDLNRIRGEFVTQGFGLDYQIRDTLRAFRSRRNAREGMWYLAIGSPFGDLDVVLGLGRLALLPSPSIAFSSLFREVRLAEEAFS